MDNRLTHGGGDRFEEHDPLARLLETGAVSAERVEEARERVEEGVVGGLVLHGRREQR